MRGPTRPSLAMTLDEMVRPDRAALLVVDVQNDFCRDANRQQMIPHVAKVLEAARRAGVRVVYVQNTVVPGGLSDSPAELARRARIGLPTDTTVEGTQGHRFVDAIAPSEGDPIVRKHRLNAFTNSTLDTILRSSGIDTIVLTGTATHGCVINTAYGGIALDYHVVVVRDAVASWSRDLHEAALLLIDRTAHAVTDSETLTRVWAMSRAPQPAVSSGP